MGLLDRFRRKKTVNTVPGQDATSETGVVSTSNRTQTVFYKGVEITLTPAEDGSIRLDRVTQGEAATGTFYYQLFDLLRDRMDIGLVEDTRYEGTGKRSNRMSGNNEWIYVEGTMDMVRSAIEKLHAEPDVARPPARQETSTAARASTTVAAPDQPVSKGEAHNEDHHGRPKHNAQKAPKVKEKPEPSPELVMHALRHKRGKDPLNSVAITQFELLVKRVVQQGQSPHTLFDDDARALKNHRAPGLKQDRFTVAEMKAFRKAVDEVYGQRAASI